MIHTADLHSLNFRFFLMLQKTAQGSPSLASTMFGVSEEMAGSIAESSMDKLERMANTNAVMFRARFDARVLDAIQSTDSPVLRGVLIESGNHH